MSILLATILLFTGCILFDLFWKYRIGFYIWTIVITIVIWQEIHLVLEK